MIVVDESETTVGILAGVTFLRLVININIYVPVLSLPTKLERA